MRGMGGGEGNEDDLHDQKQEDRRTYRRSGTRGGGTWAAPVTRD